MQTERLEKYRSDEVAALQELRLLVGAGRGRLLDCSSESLGVLDGFVQGLTSRPNWHTADWCQQFGDIRAWLALRLAYYIGAYARREYGSEWYMGPAHRGGMPVMAVDSIEFCPLEVSWAILNGERAGGLVDFFAGLEADRLRRR